MNAPASSLLASSLARSVTPYEPAVVLSRPQFAKLNAVAMRRRPFATELAGKPLVIANAGIGRMVPQAEPLCHFAIEAQQATLSLPQSLTERLVACAQSGLGLPDEPLRSLLVELVLADSLDALEKATSDAMTLGPANAPRNDIDRVRFDIRWGDWRGQALLSVPRNGDGRSIVVLSDLLERLPAAPAPLDGLPLSLGLEIGTSRLSVSQLAGLHAGDVVLLHHFHPASAEIVLTAGRTAARAGLDRRTVTVHSPFRPHSLHPMETSMKPTDAVGAQSADTGVALDQIEVMLTFEFGRRTIDLRALRMIGPGHTFDLGRDPEGPVDILANGRTIGTGEIVRVGETIGVRAVRLFTHD